MASKPMQETLKHLRKAGWTCCIVEKYIAAIKQRKDAYGFGDVLACRAPDCIALVQTTSAAHFAERRAKILAIPGFHKWKDAGGLVFLHSWGLRSKDGKRGARKVWTLREEVL